MNRAERRALKRLLGLTVVSRVLTCSSCGDSAVHIEAWEGDDDAHGLPLELSRCECGGFYIETNPPTSP
jgi:hypothetical protein